MQRKGFMKLYRWFIGYSILSLFIPILLEAGAGSVYSRFGIGERRFFPSGRSAAMGGTSIALRGAAHINQINPASWSDLYVVQFSGSLLYEGVRSDDGINSADLGSGNLNGAVLALPVMPSRGLTIGLGFGPMSRVSYNVESSRTVQHGTQVINYSGTGGITAAMLGASYRLHPDLSIGALLQYRSGIIEYFVDSYFNVSLSTGYIPSSTERVHSVTGVAGSFGLIYSGILPKRRDQTTGPLTLGLLFTTPSRLSVDEDYRIRYENISDTTFSKTGTIELPYLVGFGISYLIDRRNTVAVDVRYEPWENFKKFGEFDSQLKNSVRVGVGWERAGDLEPGSSFFQRMAYRFGFFYNASYFNIQDTPINESFVTAGIGIPLSGIAVLNIATQVGIRGTTDYNLQKDRIVRLLFSLNMFERWFVPPVRE
jgi:hypothetical protein